MGNGKLRRSDTPDGVVTIPEWFGDKRFRGVRFKVYVYEVHPQHPFGEECGPMGFNFQAVSHGVPLGLEPPSLPADAKVFQATIDKERRERKRWQDQVMSVCRLIDKWSTPRKGRFTCGPGVTPDEMVAALTKLLKPPTPAPISRAELETVLKDLLPNTPKGPKAEEVLEGTLPAYTVKPTEEELKAAEAEDTDGNRFGRGIGKVWHGVLHDVFRPKEKKPSFNVVEIKVEDASDRVRQLMVRVAGNVKGLPLIDTIMDALRPFMAPSNPEEE